MIKGGIDKGGKYMTETIKKRPFKITNFILLIVVIGIGIYIAEIQGWINLYNKDQKKLVESGVLLTLDVKEKAFVGVNSKQIYKVTTDGIKTYDFDKQEIWSDTFSLPNIIVKQRTPYIAIGSKEGKSVILFNDKGRQSEITTTNPIIYFSVNQEGSVVVIEESEDSHIVTAYDQSGRFLCNRTSFIKKDGYPVVAELSPNSKLLLVSYINVNEPQIVSTLLGIDITDKQTEKLDNIKYGIKQKDNLIYAIEFINKNTWVGVGDKKTIWYNLEGNELVVRDDIYAVFTPCVMEISKYGEGYLPLVISEKPTQNIIHRQDRLIYLDSKGQELFKLEIEDGVENFYSDSSGIVYKSGESFKGYDRLGNNTFEYKPTLDINKVIYSDTLKKGIAISKEKVVLLTAKEERK